MSNLAAGITVVVQQDRVNPPGNTIESSCLCFFLESLKFSCCLRVQIKHSRLHDRPPYQQACQSISYDIRYVLIIMRVYIVGSSTGRASEHLPAREMHALTCAVCSIVGTLIRAHRTKGPTDDVTNCCLPLVDPGVDTDSPLHRPLPAQGRVTDHPPGSARPCDHPGGHRRCRRISRRHRSHQLWHLPRVDHRRAGQIWNHHTK